jgi:methyl-accepting chemotaxis protein
LDVKFFHDYILIPVTDIAQDMTDEKKSVFGTIRLQEYIKDRTVHFPKLTEFLLYSVASSFLDVILKNGADPNFVTKNDNTNEIAEFLNKKSETDVSGDDYRAKSKNLYELFFSSVPAYIEKHVEEHWQLIFRYFIKQKDLTRMYFHKNAVLANFELSLPLKDDSGTFKAVTFNGFFQAIKSGKGALRSLVVDIRENTEQLKTQNNGKRKGNQDILDTAEGTDEDDDDDDVNKKPRRKK